MNSVLQEKGDGLFLVAGNVILQGSEAAEGETVFPWGLPATIDVPSTSDEKMYVLESSLFTKYFAYQKPKT